MKGLIDTSIFFSILYLEGFRVFTCVYGSFADGEQPAARIKDLAAIKALNGAIPISVQGVLARELVIGGDQRMQTTCSIVNILWADAEVLTKIATVSARVRSPAAEAPPAHRPLAAIVLVPPLLRGVPREATPLEGLLPVPQCDPEPVHDEACVAPEPVHDEACIAPEPGDPDVADQLRMDDRPRLLDRPRAHLHPRTAFFLERSRRLSLACRLGVQRCTCSLGPWGHDVTFYSTETNQVSLPIAVPRTQAESACI